MIYPAKEDSLLLCKFIKKYCKGRVLDMGTGCGILAILATGKASKVVAVDINPQAIACTKKNAELNGVKAKIETRLGNLFGAIETDEKLDIILFNAPYLPVENDEGKSWIEKAWAGGKTGRKLIDQYIGKAPKHLAENGRILLVQSSLSNIETTLNRFSQHNLCTTIIAEEKSAFERIVLIEARRQPF